LTPAGTRGTPILKRPTLILEVDEVRLSRLWRLSVELRLPRIRVTRDQHGLIGFHDLGHSVELCKAQLDVASPQVKGNLRSPGYRHEAQTRLKSARLAVPGVIFNEALASDLERTIQRG
jgi:hypothetical protein